MSCYDLHELVAKFDLMVADVLEYLLVRDVHYSEWTSKYLDLLCHFLRKTVLLLLLQRRRKRRNILETFWL